MTDTPVILRPTGALGRAELRELNEQFETAHPRDIIRWAADAFGSKLYLTTSFTDTLLIDVAVSVEPDVKVMFLDTGFHFAETLSTMREAQRRYRLDLTVARPDYGTAADVWRDGSDACCRDRKVHLLESHLVPNASAWLSGLRRSDSVNRADAPIVEIDRRGLVKINPLAAWPDADVEQYIAERHVIRNPLQEQGYDSIGCWPCTEPSVDGIARSGRWAGSDKTECGLHL